MGLTLSERCVWDSSINHSKTLRTWHSSQFNVKSWFPKDLHRVKVARFALGKLVEGISGVRRRVPWYNIKDEQLMITCINLVDWKMKLNRRYLKFVTEIYLKQFQMPSSEGFLRGFHLANILYLNLSPKFPNHSVAKWEWTVTRHHFVSW